LVHSAWHFPNPRLESDWIVKTGFRGFIGFMGRPGRQDFTMGVWQGDYLKYHPGLSCPTILCPAGRPPLKQSYGRSRIDPPAEWAFYGHLLPLWTPHTVQCTPMDFMGFEEHHYGSGYVVLGQGMLTWVRVC
jgi:hypothetical protein